MSDKELLRLVKSFTKGLTKGNVDQLCFVVCWPLSGYLNMCGIECELIEGEVDTPHILWGHYWIKLSDGRILDPTAGQFKELNMPQIYIGELPKEYSTKITA